MNKQELKQELKGMNLAQVTTRLFSEELYKHIFVSRFWEIKLTTYIKGIDGEIEFNSRNHKHWGRFSSVVVRSFDGVEWDVVWGDLK